MKVLIGCEFSGIVRSAFAASGHDAWSCDILPSEQEGCHIQGNVLEILNNTWDMAIFHPPCTYLANSGARWLYGGKGNEKDLSRWQAMEDAAEFFKILLNAPIPKIAIENPIMHTHGKLLIDMPYAQIIHPWQFGHGESKATCLWLKNLPALVPTEIVEGRTPRVHHASPGKDRWKERSRTYSGIAKAMAEQWAV
jgi:hypothetical protein